MSLFNSLKYQLKYLAEKERNKNIYYREIVGKVELRMQVDDLKRTVKHQKEIINSLREEIKKGGDKNDSKRINRIIA